MQKLVRIALIFLIFVLIFLIFLKKELKDENIFIVPKTITTANRYIPKLPKLEQIFTDNHGFVATLSAQNLRVLMVTGDVIPARSVNFQIATKKDYNWPFEKTKNVLRSADITFINLETPLIDNCLQTNEGMVFCGNSKNLEGLMYAGVDVASLANNHAGNHGIEGVLKTKDLLEKNGILTTGTAFSNLAIKDLRGIKFAFLGFDDITKPQPGISLATEDSIKKEIAAAKKIADLVIVTFHWGVEYRNLPDDRQKFLGYLAVDSGADLVIGNHPHWIQPIEIYKGKLITFAHGNFVFDQEWSEQTKLGVVGKYTFYDDQLIDAEYFPVKIEDFGQPHFLQGADKRKILDEMKINSFKLIEKN